MSPALLVHTQLLTRLLKSNLPEDLRAANELIQTLVKEVRRRGFQWALRAGRGRVHVRVHTLEVVGTQ